MFRFRPKKRKGNMIAFVVFFFGIVIRFIVEAKSLLLLFLSFIFMGTCVNSIQVVLIFEKLKICYKK